MKFARVDLRKNCLASAETKKFASWKSWSLDHAAQIDPLRNSDLFDREVDDYEVYSLRD